jgi:hypothetical protein
MCASRRCHSRRVRPGALNPAGRRQSHIQEGQGDGVDQGHIECSSQCLLRAVISQTRGDQDIGRQAVKRCPVSLARPLIGDEEECFVRFDWAAEQAAENVTLQNRSLHARGFQEWVIGIERVVSEVFIGGSMKVVGAALGDSLNVAAAGTAEGGIIKRSLHLEFLDGLRRRHGEIQ